MSTQGNQVRYYDAATVLTTTPVLAFDAGQGNNVLEVQNDTTSDIIVTFDDKAMLIKASTKKIQNFISGGVIKLATTAGSSSGNFFLQVSRG